MPALRPLALALALVAALALPRPAAASEAHEVLGYYPFWTQTTGTASWRWDLLTIVAYFSAEVGWDGMVADWRGWDGEAGRLFVEECKARGVKPILTVASFNADVIQTMVTTQRIAVAEQIAEAVAAAGGEGVNLDFEQVGPGVANDVVQFVVLLKGVLGQYIDHPHVSLAMPAVDWSDRWDYAQLASVADFLMIMGYDYYWSTSDPGPLAPLRSGGRWSPYNVEATINDYIAEVSPAFANKLLLGVPLYGYDWPSNGPEVPGTKRGAASAVPWAAAESRALEVGRQWDEASHTPYYVYEDTDGWHQVFYEDPESLGHKFDLVKEHGLGGIGIWALTYEGQSGSFWQTVDDHLEPKTGGTDGDGDDDAEPLGGGGGSHGWMAGGCSVGGPGAGAGGTGLLIVAATAGLLLMSAGMSRRARRIRS